MALTPEQIADLLQIIRDGSTAIAIRTAGHTVTKPEFERLQRAGYLPKTLTYSTMIQDSYALGRLMQQQAAAKNWTYKELRDHLAKNPVDTSPAERQAIEIAQRRAGTYCVGLGNTYSQETHTLLIEADQALAQRTREGIRKETSEAIAKRETVKQLKSRLGNMMGDWKRDWDRIAASETHQAHQDGVANEIAARGDDERAAKVPEPDACEKCKDAYLEDGKPMVRPMSWWMGQPPTNAGRKQADWVPARGAMHPWCFPAGQRVLTARGEIPIEQVEVGEWVVSTAGHWRRVTQTFRHYHVGALRVLSDGQRTVRSTPNHEFQSGGAWKPAETIDVGAELDQVRFAQPDDGPSVAFEKPRFARVLFGLSPGGVPITAVDLDGQLAAPFYKVDQKTTDDLIAFHRKAEGAERGQETLFQFRTWFTSGLEQALAHFIVRTDRAPIGFVSPAGQVFALRGGQALHADLIRFRSIALGDSRIMQALDDGAACHPQLKGYRLYGQALVPVQADDQSIVHPMCHQAKVGSRSVGVKSAVSQVWHGWVHNLSVDVDESYVVEGFATHNCQCQFVRVPAGWGFDDGWNLVPLDEDEAEKSMRKVPETGTLRKAGPFIGPKGDLQKSRKLHGRMKFQGFEISIENRKGSVRRWYDQETDTTGETKMQYPYGYIRRTEGADGDHVDVFVGPHADAKNVYVVHQRKAPLFKEFDEDKCMLGFKSAKAAKAAYLQHYDRPEFFGSMTTLNLEAFRAKVYGAKGKMIKADPNQLELIPREPLLVEWMWAVQKAGVPFAEFGGLVQKARAGGATERERLNTVYAHLEKAQATESLYVDLGLDVDIVGQMGIQAYPKEKKKGPRRSPLRGQAHQDWPVGRIDIKQPDRRTKNPKLLVARDRFNVKGVRSGEPAKASPVSGYENVVQLRPPRPAINEQSAKESLYVQQRGRADLRQGMKLHGMEIKR